jgi:CheY-like chemotaxis protein
VARTILVADDSPTVQKKASGILTGEGLDVVTVSNGVAAVKKMAAVKPLMVLADVAMPGKDGYEVCEFVKSSVDLAHIPVVLIFSEMDSYEAARGARVQVDGTIRKPFDRDELIATVSKFVAQAEAAAPKPAVEPLPVPAVVVEPEDEEPEVATVPPAPDYSAFSEGVAFAAPLVEEAPSAMPEPVPPPELAVSQEPIVEAEVPAELIPAVSTPLPEEARNPEVAMSEPVPEPVAEPEAVEAGPVLIEEQAAPPVEMGPPEPPPEPTTIFHALKDIAQPIVSEELEPAEAVAEIPHAEPLHPPATEPPLAAKAVESYTPEAVVAGEVRVESTGSEIVREAHPEVAPPPPAPPAMLDRERIYAIVHKVVVKMSPPAMTDQMIEEIAHKFAAEISAELDSQPS